MTRCDCDHHETCVVCVPSLHGENTIPVADVLGWLRTRAIADAAGDGAMFQKAATLLYDFKINAKALLIHCDAMGSGDAIYSLQCLRRLVEKMESPNV